ncbi:MAG: hypothetical protein ABR920_08560 [Terriglobales bacterium]
MSTDLIGLSWKSTFNIKASDDLEVATTCASRIEPTIRVQSLDIVR